MELVSKNASCTWPVGGLGNDVTINFLHYGDFKEAYEKWEQRKTRVNYNNIFVVLTDRDGFSVDKIKQVDLIPYKKVFFSSKKIDREYVVYMPEFRKEDCVGVMTDFYRFSGKRYYDLHFDFEKWLTGRYNTSECRI